MYGNSEYRRVELINLEEEEIIAHIETIAIMMLNIRIRYLFDTSLSTGVVSNRSYSSLKLATISWFYY